MDIVNTLPDESVGSNEEAHLLESNMHTQQCGGRRQTFSMKKFILLWLGIGHFYCELNVGTYWKMHTPFGGDDWLVLNSFYPSPSSVVYKLPTGVNVMLKITVHSDVDYVSMHLYWCRCHNISNL